MGSMFEANKKDCIHQVIEQIEETLKMIITKSGVDMTERTTIKEFHHSVHRSINAFSST